MNFILSRILNPGVAIVGHYTAEPLVEPEKIMPSEKIPYEKQIFVCTNNRNGEKPSCGDTRGEEFFRELRRVAKERGYHPRCRVAQAKCLGKCGMGNNVMIYPDNVWYHHLGDDDLPALIEKYFPKT